jgi:hypothetical protein
MFTVQIAKPLRVSVSVSYDHVVIRLKFRGLTNCTIPCIKVIVLPLNKYPMILDSYNNNYILYTKDLLLDDDDHHTYPIYCYGVKLLVQAFVHHISGSEHK